jgi:hypothetical protein
MLSTSRKVALYAKNLLGAYSKKRLVAFSVDDYGNVFLKSKSARTSLGNAGLPVSNSRFSMFDALEDRHDLEGLFDTLTAVKDHRGQPAVFTVFALPANLDFDRIESSGFQEFFYQTLPETFAANPGYEGTWSLWQEGMQSGLIVPQFHGREHLNVRLFERLLQVKDQSLMLNLKNRSYACIKPSIGTKVGFTEAFSFDSFEETEEHKIIIRDGYRVFKDVFRKTPTVFKAPGASEHSSLHQTIAECGGALIDVDVYRKELQANGFVRRSFSTLGSTNRFGQRKLLRNVVFEPLLSDSAVENSLAEINIAFQCGKPANISSHRVNFCGKIDPKVRDIGLAQLKRLLKEILKRWPDVEFRTSDDLLT